MPRQATTKPDSSTGTIGFEVSVPVRKDLANGSMSSNQSGDCPARSAMKTTKAKPQSLPRQRDIRPLTDIRRQSRQQVEFATNEAWPETSVRR